ncbi:MAG: adenine deaminase [Desulfobulbus sp.]|nr:MAG: adenine deaminase [Desulfobulbus sp.]
MNIENYTKLIDCAAGRIPADLVLDNAKVIHVYTGEISKGSVAIIDGKIAGISDGYDAENTVDLQGRYLAPGFVEGHIHIESSMLIPSQFAAAVIPHGTTTVICDPHEIANVCGITGIHFMLEDSSPLTIYAMAPSCVPATHMETSGASLSVSEIETILNLPGVIGLAEMMNFPGMVMAVQDVIEKTLLAINQRKIIDGHAPGLTGKALQAYVAGGITSDHECTLLSEALEKLKAGMAVFIREGSTAHNLEELMPVIQSPAAQHCLLVTDDRHADDLITDGHLDHILQRAVSLGANPVTAIQMVTLNAARHFGLKDIGAITPGAKADLVVLDDLSAFTVSSVFIKGELCATSGSMVTPVPTVPVDTLESTIQSSIKISPEKVDLTVPANEGKIRVICCVEDQLVTEQRMFEPKIVANQIVSDPERDIIKIAVIERHHIKHSMGLGFVKGLGIKDGAIASTVAHDSHNLVVAGSSDKAMLLALAKIMEMQGGLVVAGEKKIHGALPLPVAGLMSTASVAEVSSGLLHLHEALNKIETSVDNPFMLLSFLALPVIPELKITDKGLVDVNKFTIVPLQEQKKIKK